MARNKALSLFLAVVLVLAIVAPLLVVEAQISLAVQLAQGGPSFNKAGSSALAAPVILAGCEGCSGGGSGPG